MTSIANLTAANDGGAFNGVSQIDTPSFAPSSASSRLIVWSSFSTDGTLSETLSVVSGLTGLTFTEIDAMGVQTEAPFEFNAKLWVSSVCGATTSTVLRIAPSGDTDNWGWIWVGELIDPAPNPVAQFSDWYYSFAQGSDTASVTLPATPRGLTLALFAGGTDATLTWGTAPSGYSTLQEDNAAYTSGCALYDADNTSTGVSRGVTSGLDYELVGFAAEFELANEPKAEAATATGSAFSATASVAPSGGAATATGAAYDATVDTGGDANAPAEAATATGSSFDASAAVAANAEAATATGAASDAAPSVSVNAEAATGTGSAFDATVHLAPPSEAATATGMAFDATVNITANAEAATASGSAFDATVSAAAPGAANAEAATATGAAYDATVTVQVSASAATARAEAPDATVTVVAGSAPPSGSWGGFQAIVTVRADQFRYERRRPPVACPNDGHPLAEDGDGRLRCPFDGWMPRGDG